MVVAIDVGKTSLMVSATDDARRQLMGPAEFAMTRSGLVAATECVLALAPSCLQVTVGVEAAGHYHRPVADYRWPPGWKVVELNPAHVAEQRRVMGRRRLKTDKIARRVLASDVALLADLDSRIVDAETELARLLPLSPFSTLISVPGWGVVRSCNYAAALSDPARWPGPRQIYRASGLSPMQYESASKRRDGSISREGSVALRRALIDLGIGLWLAEPAAKSYAHGLKDRGKHGGVIACALAHRANRIAHALVRDHAVYNPARWT
jgi:transposase